MVPPPPKFGEPGGAHKSPKSGKVLPRAALLTPLEKHLELRPYAACMPQSRLGRYAGIQARFVASKPPGGRFEQFCGMPRQKNGLFQRRVNGLI